MKLQIISIMALGLLMGCVQDKPQPLPKNIAKVSVNRINERVQPVRKWEETRYVSSSGCNWQTKDSITCRIKRIQINLDRLEQNSLSAMGGIGDCKDCGN